MDLCRRMCPLSVAVARGKRILISVGVRLGMVASSSLRWSAPRSVADGGEHVHLVDVSGIFGGRQCGVNVGGDCKGRFSSWVCMFTSMLVCRLDVGVLKEHHPQACLGALVSTDDCPAAIYNGAIDLCEGHCASRVAHDNNGEKGVGCQAKDDMGCSCASWEILHV